MTKLRLWPIGLQPKSNGSENPLTGGFFCYAADFGLSNARCPVFFV
jgi:hypothetical protein